MQCIPGAGELGFLAPLAREKKCLRDLEPKMSNLVAARREASAKLHPGAMVKTRQMG